MTQYLVAIHHPDDFEPRLRVGGPGVFAFDSVWIEKNTSGCRKVDTVFAHVLLSFGDVPFEVHTFILRVTRRYVKYAEIEERLPAPILQVNSSTATASECDRVQSNRKRCWTAKPSHLFPSC